MLCPLPFESLIQAEFYFKLVPRRALRVENLGKHLFYNFFVPSLLGENNFGNDSEKGKKHYVSKTLFQTRDRTPPWTGG
jgi:hypothetical protein